MTNEPDSNEPTADDITDSASETKGAITTMEPDESSAPSPPNPPGPQAPPPPGAGAGMPRMHPASPNGLTRDPYSSLGGVASGIAHRYGLSTALVRLAFVVVLIFTFFFALPVYLAAWAIIPRATVWPPVPLRLPGQKISGRDIGVLALVGGLLAFLLFGVDGVGPVLVSLAFIGAGIALLLQHERQPLPPATEGSPVSSGAVPPLGVAATAPVGEPVPPRSGGRKWFLRLAIAGVAVFFAAIVALPIALLSFGDLDSFDIETGTFDFRFDDEVALVDVEPTDLADLPRSIDAEGGDIKIDLSGIDVADFEALSVPVDLDIELGGGDIEIILPEGLEYSIDADVERGEINAELNGDVVTSNSSSSRGESLTVDNDDADLDLMIDLRFGDITLETAR